MAGKKGMPYKNRANAVRRMIWRSMRVMRVFTLDGLTRTVPGASYGNVRKFVQGMYRHGIVNKVGGYVSGRAGEQQQYVLAKNSGPNYPTVCDVCGQTLSAKICDPSIKEKEKETKKERKEAAPHDNDRPDAASAR